MKLSTRSRYGLRAMTYIAANEDRAPISTSEIAQALELSDSYLEQLFRLLKGDHFIRSVRGIRGGYELARPSDQIRILDLLNCLEGALWLADCTQCGECPGGNLNCPTRLIIRRMSQAIEETTQSETLADMAELYRAI